MTFGPASRLVIAAAASVALHVVALAPLQPSKGRHGVSGSFQPVLNVVLHDHLRPVLEFAPRTISPTASDPLSLRVAPSFADMAANFLSLSPLATFPAQSGNSDTPTLPVENQRAAYGPKGGSTPTPEMRMALPDEVSVRVRLYDRNTDDNPNEVIDMDTGRYFYFNAPRLKQAAHPLSNARPHYPAAAATSQSGKVVLQLLISEDGSLEKTLVTCGHSDFEKSAIASVREMRFRAAHNADGPVKSYMMVEFGYGQGGSCGKNPYDAFLDQRLR
jgi:TonB family protein